MSFVLCLLFAARCSFFVVHSGDVQNGIISVLSKDPTVNFERLQKFFAKCLRELGEEWRRMCQVCPVVVARFEVHGVCSSSWRCVGLVLCRIVVRQIAAYICEQSGAGSGKGARPRWQPDADVRSCCYCLSGFSMIRRRHHVCVCCVLVPTCAVWRTVSLQSSSLGFPCAHCYRCSVAAVAVYFVPSARQKLQPLCRGRGQLV